MIFLVHCRTLCNLHSNQYYGIRPSLARQPHRDHCKTCARAQNRIFLSIKLISLPRRIFLFVHCCFFRYLQNNQLIGTIPPEGSATSLLSCKSCILSTASSSLRSDITVVIISYDLQVPLLESADWHYSSSLNTGTCPLRIASFPPPPILASLKML